MTKADPIAHKCRTRYRAAHHDGRRRIADIHLCVMHSTEGPTAEAAARWFANPKSKGSAHLCVDDKRCYQTLPPSFIPWAAPGANRQGFHIEMAGFAAWAARVWGTKHRKTLERAAYKAAKACHAYKIPPRWVSAAGLKAGHKGITTHAECSKAFGGDHTDPGRGWPRRLFMRRVRHYYRALEARNG